MHRMSTPSRLAPIAAQPTARPFRRDFAERRRAATASPFPARFRLV